MLSISKDLFEIFSPVSESLSELVEQIILLPTVRPKINLIYRII